MNGNFGGILEGASEVDWVTVTLQKLLSWLSKVLKAFDAQFSTMP